MSENRREVSTLLYVARVLTLAKMWEAMAQSGARVEGHTLGTTLSRVHKISKSVFSRNTFGLFPDEICGLSSGSARGQLTD